MKKKSLSARIRTIELVIFDIDGVLTDGTIYLGSDGVETKAFNVQDGIGIKYLQRAGLKVAFLTGRTSPAVDARAKELGITLVIQGSKYKSVGLEQLLKRAKIAAENACFVGDDLVDVPAMLNVGVAIAVANARPEVKRLADLTTRAEGGRGAAREVVELILKTQRKWDMILSRYFPSASGKGGKA